MKLNKLTKLNSWDTAGQGKRKSNLPIKASFSLLLEVPRASPGGTVWYLQLNQPHCVLLPTQSQRAKISNNTIFASSENLWKLPAVLPQAFPQRQLAVGCAVAITCLRDAEEQEYRWGESKQESPCPSNYTAIGECPRTRHCWVHSPIATDKWFSVLWIWPFFWANIWNDSDPPRVHELERSRVFSVQQPHSNRIKPLCLLWTLLPYFWSCLGLRNMHQGSISTTRTSPGAFFSAFHSLGNVWLQPQQITPGCPGTITSHHRGQSTWIKAESYSGS